MQVIGLPDCGSRRQCASEARRLADRDGVTCVTMTRIDLIYVCLVNIVSCRV